MFIEHLNGFQTRVGLAGKAGGINDAEKNNFRIIPAGKVGSNANCLLTERSFVDTNNYLLVHDYVFLSAAFLGFGSNTVSYAG